MKRAKSGRVSSYVVRLEPEQLAQLQLQLAAGPARPPRPPAPTLSEVFERFMTWSRANRQKPATLATKESLWRCHLEPRFGKKPADQLQLADVEALKAAIAGKLSAKRTNTLLAVLRKMLRLAVKRGELERVPCEIEAVTQTRSDFEFYDFDQYAKLVAATAKVGLRELVVVLLGGDAGLRMSEKIALRRCDVDVPRRRLHVRHSDWNGTLIAPKGGRSRVVPLTQLLVAALGALFQRIGGRSDARVLVTGPGDRFGRPPDAPLTIERIRTLMRRAQRAAGLEETGNLHVLRHTFCSHLAMRGAATVAIKNLAGHTSISTTEKYMHLADTERSRTIGLLDLARSNAGVGQPRSPTQEASSSPESAALTPRRFELLGDSQVDWLEHLLGPP